MKVVVVARTNIFLEELKYAPPLIEVIDERYLEHRSILAVFNEDNVTQENFRAKIIELRKKYCKIFKTDQLTILVPKREVKYIE